MFILLCFAAAIPAYVIGGINGAIITSISFYRKDIRKYGSGNPGLTNFYRVFGKGGTALVFLIDVAKTAVPVLFGGWLFSRFSFDMQLFGRELAGLFVMLGHCFPIYYGFQGGKGVMAVGVISIIIDWRVALIAWGAFLVIAAITRYVSLGAIIGVTALPIAQAAFGLGGAAELVIAILCALLLIGRHQGNIRRIIHGNESRLKFHKDKEI